MIFVGSFGRLVQTFRRDILPPSAGLQIKWRHHTMSQTRRPIFSLSLRKDCVNRKTGRGNKAESSWNVMAHGDAREGKRRGNWRMEWVASTLHTTSEYGVSSITTADAHTSAASSLLNWRNCRFKWIRPFRRRNLVSACVPSHFNRPLLAYRASSEVVAAV